jgi:hypothetical protein
MTAAPCKECGHRPKALPAQRCLTCQLRHTPIGEQVDAARRRLAMVPPELRVKRGKRIMALAPASTAWCAGCQSFRDLVDFGKSATQCRACVSASQHGAMVAKTYGLTADDYDELLARQGGRCAICRAKPKSKRLAVDHDHKTGTVRGLLCSRCNHDLMGSAWDSMAMASALWHYMNTPPASGSWLPPERQAPLSASLTAQDFAGGTFGRPSEAGSASSKRAIKAGTLLPGDLEQCERPHYLPVGAVSVPGVRGVFRVWVGDDPEPPF